MAKKGIMIVILLTIFTIVMCASTKEKYADCSFYMGYNQENEQYPIVYWLVNQADSSYVSYVNLSDEYHTSCFFLDGNSGEIREMSLTLDGRGGLYKINVLTIVCNNESTSYYPQDIIENFSIEGAQDFFITEEGILFIQTTNQDCVLTLKENICSKLNMLRAT